MTECRCFLTCSAPLCPLDPEINKRSWFVGEEVCPDREHKGEPWIKRQRKLNRTAPVSLMDHPLDVDYLTRTAPKKRILSPEHRAKLIACAKSASLRTAKVN